MNEFIQSTNTILNLLKYYKKPPEWISQYHKISTGEMCWDDLTFEQRTCKGWLLPYLLQIDAMFSKRWIYWVRTLSENKPLEEPIPKISFSHPDKAAIENIKKCLQRFCHLGVSLNDFLDWLLWGFAQSKDRANISGEVNEFWYRTFNLGLMIRTPYDYLGEIMAEQKSGYWSNPHAFFPTPHHVVELMTQITYSDQHDYREKEICDPCMGTGRMLLHASNYSLRLYGMDIDQSCCKATMVNGYIYAPWMVKPPTWDSPKITTTNMIKNPIIPLTISEQPVIKDKKIGFRLEQLELF